MKGFIDLAPKIIGYVIILAVFVGLMMVISRFWFDIQTIPTETSDKATSCDLAYTLSLWDDATVYPNIFDKAFLEESWNEKKRNDTANAIFENMSGEFYLPGSDFFFHISDGEKVYSLYVPPESISVYESCAGATVSKRDYEKLESSGLTEVITKGNLEIIGGTPEELPKNQLYSVCPLTTFVADKDEVEIGTMVSGLTTNVATKLREGIHQVGVDGKDRYVQDLGSYPEGCFVNRGQISIEEKTPIKKILDNPVISFLSWIFLIRPALEVMDVGWITIEKNYASCGFKWDWDTETRVLSVTPSALNIGGCEILTRIPKIIVDENNLSKKICRPKEVFAPVWFPEGNDLFGQGKKHFFLTVEDARGGIKDAKEFCKTSCEDDGLCKTYCDKGNILEPELCSKIFSTKEKRGCLMAQISTKTFFDLPEDAINIKYYVVDEKFLTDEKGFDDLVEGEYSVYQACGTWPSVFECGSSTDCEMKHCVYAGVEKKNGGEENNQEVKKLGGCNFCLEDSKGALCSPNYLEIPPSIDDALYTCQNIRDVLWPKDEAMSECLPYIEVEKYLLKDEKREEITDNKIDCSQNPNAEVVWVIDASTLCDSGYVEDDAGVKITTEIPNFCPKMKFWPNMNSSEVLLLKKDDAHILEITQQVCRNSYSYNNAGSAFITAHYQASEKAFEYSLDNSAIELVSPVGAEGGQSAESMQECNNEEEGVIACKTNPMLAGNRKHVCTNFLGLYRWVPVVPTEMC